MEFFIGQVFLGGWNFAPQGSALCNGALMAVSQNEALFSLIGTIYGGDGRTTFGLPDLRGRVPVHKGQGPGLTNRPIGSKGGMEWKTLTQANLPSHTHQLMAAPGTATSGTADGRALAHETRGSADVPDIYEDGTPSILMGASAVSTVGGGSSMTEMQPFLSLTYCIATVGLYPSKT